MRNVMFSISPTGTVTAIYGEVSDLHSNGHKGFDFACNPSDEIYTPLTGIVSRIVDQPNSLGHGVFIKLQDGKQMIFGHMSEIYVRVGDIVHQNDALGRCGTTGRSTGYHLHFGVLDKWGKFMNPLELFKSLKVSLGSSITEATYAFANLGMVDSTFYDLFKSVAQTTIAI